MSAIEDSMGRLKTKMRSGPQLPEKLYRCGLCLDSGWQETDTTSRGTVRRCPKGCDLPRKQHPEWIAPKTGRKSGNFS